MEHLQELLDVCINLALDEVYEKDAYLLEHKIHERAIVFRFGYYLQNIMSHSEILREYDLDFEYNRNKDDLKRLRYTNQNGAYPDLIIHKRGSNEHNLLVMEFKPYWNSVYNHDRDKLLQFTEPDGIYKFFSGKFICLQRTRQEVRIITFSRTSHLSKRLKK